MNNYIYTESDCPIIKSRLFSKFPELIYGTSTRHGGVSEGIYSSMNLGRDTADSFEKIFENYCIISKELGITPERIVLGQQTHKCNVKVVTEEDCGKGLFKERDYTDIDALIYCNKDGKSSENALSPVLAILTADCVPVLIYDPLNRAIGIAHSGWRGTVGEITKAALLKMQKDFGTDPANVYISTGPCICKDCYEVSKDVADEFSKVYNETELKSIVFPGKREDKYQVDLTAAIKTTAINAGVRPENIEIQNICTNCNPMLLFSHRFTAGKRGTMATFIGLR